ncbi:hypothetical protein DSECCO2_608740 [anaerobic digester metagenome]
MHSSPENGGNGGYPAEIVADLNCTEKISFIYTVHVMSFAYYHEAAEISETVAQGKVDTCVTKKTRLLILPVASKSKIMTFLV